MVNHILVINSVYQTKRKDLNKSRYTYDVNTYILKEAFRFSLVTFTNYASIKYAIIKHFVNFYKA